MPAWSKASVSTPMRTRPRSGSSVTREDALQNIFRKAGCKTPDWQEVCYFALGKSSIVGWQVGHMALLQAMIPRHLEFEYQPGKWERVLCGSTDDDQVEVAKAIAVGTQSRYRSESGNPDSLFYAQSEIYNSCGEGYGIDFVGRDGKPASSIVHTRAVEVQSDGSALWHRRKGAEPVYVPAQNIERLFVPDTTHDLDATSPFKSLHREIMTLEIVNAALRHAAQSDMFMRGLLWAPSDSTTAADHWVMGLMQTVEDMVRDPWETGLISMMPYPVTYDGSKPEHINFGHTIQETLVKMHELMVDVISRASIMPAKLVKDGPGEGQAYGDVMLQRTFLTTYAKPLLSQRIYPDFDAWWLHPRLDRNAEFRATGIESCRFRTAGDVAGLAQKPDRLKEIIEVWKCGGFKLSYLMEAFGADLNDMLTSGDPEWADFLERRVALAANSANGLGDSLNLDEFNEVDGTQGTPTGPRFAALPVLAGDTPSDAIEVEALW